MLHSTRDCLVALKSGYLETLNSKLKLPQGTQIKNKVVFSGFFLHSGKETRSKKKGLIEFEYMEKCANSIEISFHELTFSLMVCFYDSRSMYLR